jgi:UDP-N-acetylglucosamine 2-epimerase (non-hydrolysing)
VIWPIHPRAKKQIKKFNLNFKIEKMKNVTIIKPLGYFDMLSLNSQAKFVLTDSGGIQEETTFLKVPCLTLRESTERPVTIKKGTNILCGRNKKKTIKEVERILKGEEKKGKIPKLWDGRTSQRIVEILLSKNL